MNVDIVMLVNQEPEFKKFAQDAILEGILTSPGGREFVKEVHAFYDMGMTPEQVAIWVKKVAFASGEE